MSIIYTEKNKCRGCYACVRVCPCKAIKVENSRAEVMPDLCINCGSCLRVCVPQAKQIESDIGEVRRLIASKARVIAIISSSFPVAFPELPPGQLVSALKRTGFSEVMEDAFGAEMLGPQYKRIIQEKKERPLFSSSCPAVVSYVEKYYPQLVDRLVPLVSPMIAMGRLIKQKIDPQAKVVYIGPCAAKKAESREESVAGVIDAALTFTQIEEMFADDGINLEQEPEVKFDGPKPNMGRLFAISGGLLHSAGLADDIIHNQIINAHGRDYVMSFISDIAKSRVDAHFINFFMCHGCINGPSIDPTYKRSLFRRRELVAHYTESDSNPERTKQDLEKYAGIDLSRDFKPQNIHILIPREEDVQAALKQMRKARKVDQFNCGACGYFTCRDLAVAVASGRAETNMCWPHLLKQLKDAHEGLIQAEKLSSLGQLAASIAHEVNNPLSGVLVYTQLLNKKISQDNFNKENALNYLAKMEVELTRSTKLVRNLLDFARQSPPVLRDTDLNDVINRALGLIAHSAHVLHIQVDKDLSPDLPHFLADPDQLQQVAINMILNAVQAMPNGGKMTLRTVEENGEVRMEFHDTGCGIPPENMNKLFTPFFTTKKEVKGVGLGLAVSYGIIQRHHGRIGVQSKEGEGSHFTIYLPLNYAEKSKNTGG